MRAQHEFVDPEVRARCVLGVCYGHNTALGAYLSWEVCFRFVFVETR